MVMSKYMEQDGQRVWCGTPEELAEYQAQQTSNNLQALWQAATDYTESYISGAAIGLLTIGVMQNKPKSLAVMAWINDLWTNHYYVQKPLVTYDYAGYDFSVCGAMPYTVPELTEEVLGNA